MGFLPGGSSDGMVKCVLTDSDEEYSLNNQAFVVLKGQSKMIDLVQMKSDK